jgi:hypothetical protein
MRAIPPRRAEPSAFAERNDALGIEQSDRIRPAGLIEKAKRRARRRDTLDLLYSATPNASEHT